MAASHGGMAVGTFRSPPGPVLRAGTEEGGRRISNLA